MKKTASKFAFFLSFLPLAFMAQEEKIIPCYTDEAMEHYFIANPEARTTYNEHLKEVNARQLKLEQQNLQAGKSAAAPEYTIPVVFHILYDCANPLSEITDAMCVTAIDQVNKDFSRNGSDTNLIFAPFKSLYINSDIKFMLAKKDPQGNCVNGIVRHYDSKTIWSQAAANSASYVNYTWNPTKYLNIYIVAAIVPSGTVAANGTIVGYTRKPGSVPTGDSRDAIYYDKDFFYGLDGGIPKVRSLTHEIGHWLDLAHTFGNTNNVGQVCGSLSGGDGISDTPDTKGNYSTCGASSTNTAYTCTNPNPANSNNYYQNVNNFMDYSSCARNFTSGQTTLMRATLAGATNGRNNLSTLSNLAFTNVDGSGLCAPKADFISSNCVYTVCAGNNLTFKDLSYNGAVTGYTWSANNGGVAASPNASLTAFNFPNVGTTNVTLLVSNAQGSNAKSVNVTVIDGASSIIGPYSESFEFAGVPTDWNVFNVENDALTWEQTEMAAYDQFASFYLKGNTVTIGNRTDILQMPILDVLNNQDKILEFAYAYRQNSSAQNDVFKVQASKDCGGTWTDIWVPTPSSLAYGSGGVSTDEFYPLLEEWKTYPISSSPYWTNFKNSSSVIVRYFFKSGDAPANNFFIDAVRYASPTGVNELTSSIRFGLFPNPTNGETNVTFNLNDPAKIKISVLDISGRELYSTPESTYSSGEQSIIINKGNTLPNGVYFVNLTYNGALMSAKLIIN